MKKRKSYILIVLKKELTDMFRDRRTLIVSLILPLLLYPAMFFVMDKSISPMLHSGESSVSVAINSDSETFDTLKSKVFAEGTNIAAVLDRDAAKTLKDGGCDVALVAAKGSDDRMAIDIIYDENKTASMSGYSYIQSLLTVYSQSEVTAKLEAQHIDLQELNPFSAVNVQTYSEFAGESESSGNAGMMLSMMLPLLITVFLAVGGMAISADIFAGEKERKTFEPLLCTRAGRFDILTGKLMTVTAASVLSVIASFAGMVLGYISAPNLFSISPDESTQASIGSINLPIPIILLTFIMLITVAVLFAGIYAAISMYSRTTKEANTYSSFVMIAAYLPIFATMYMQGGDVQPWMMAVPMVNIVCSLKMLLAGIINYGYIAMALAFSAAFMAVVLTFTTRLFKKESIMFRV